MKSLKQLLLYLIVGGIATIVEWVCFWIFNHWTHYLVATTIAFAVSTLSNWAVGRWIIFKVNNTHLFKELLQIYATSIVGLIFNLLIMWILVEYFCYSDMLSKIIATGIVFFWNFLVRKLFIYKV